MKATSKKLPHRDLEKRYETLHTEFLRLLCTYTDQRLDNIRLRDALGLLVESIDRGEKILVKAWGTDDVNAAYAEAWGCVRTFIDEARETMKYPKTDAQTSKE